MATTSLSKATRRGLHQHVVEAQGPWSDSAGHEESDLLLLRDPDDEVVLTGPIDVNLSVYAEDELTGASGAASLSRQPLMSHDVSVPAGATWRYGMKRLRGLGGNVGCSAWIRPTRVRPRPLVAASVDLPCDYAVRPLADTGRFFPSPCDPCEGGPIRVPPGECGPAIDVLPARGGCVRPRYFNGMFITREDLEAEQRYFRLKLRMQNRAAGAGVVWGLDVALRGEHVVVGPGYGVDCCGNDLTVTCDYAVPAATLLRDPAVCGSDRECCALLLEYVECPEDPRPVHGDGCEPKRAGCEMSRIRETARLRLVPPLSTPQTPLGRFLQRVDELLGKPTADGEIPVAGGGIVPAPDSVPVPFRVAVTLGGEVDLQPDRAVRLSDSIDPVPRSGLLSLRVSAHDPSRGLSGTVRLYDGTAVASVAATGAAWTASYGPDDTGFTYLVDWSTAQPDVLRGRTVVYLGLRPDAHLEGRVQWREGSLVSTEWPAGHGLQEGDEVFIRYSGGRTFATTVQNAGTTQVMLHLPQGETPNARDMVFYRRPGRLEVDIDPTRVTMERSAPATPCCGPGCCDEHEQLRRDRRLRALLAALLYGRIVQRSSLLATETRDSRVIGALRAFLGVPLDRVADFELAVADLYRAWCAAGLYPGPAHCDPDGVVLGCARVEGGALCAVDPLDGRRWVVHQPLLDHWAGAFGLDPLDRRVGDLFRRLCCLSHLPGFGTLVDVGLPAEDAEASPALGRFLVGELMLAQQKPSAAPTAAVLGTLGAVTDLDLPGIAVVVEELLCGGARVSKDVVREPERARSIVAEEFADLPAREQPRQTMRGVARAIAHAVLSAVPVAVAVGKDSPLVTVLESVDAPSLQDMLAVPPDVVAELAVAVAAPEQVDAGVQRANEAAATVVAAVAEAVRALRETKPEQLRGEKVVDRLAGDLVKRLGREGIEVDRETLTGALRAEVG